MARISARRRAIPEWAEQIEKLRRRLNLSQSRLGQQLQYSAMAISRWERGLQEPPADSYIKLGDLAGNPDCWYFWERAGLKSSDVIRALPLDKRLFPKSTFPDFDIVVAGSGGKKTKQGKDTTCRHTSIVRSRGHSWRGRRQYLGS